MFECHTIGSCCVQLWERSACCAQLGRLWALCRIVIRFLENKPWQQYSSLCAVVTIRALRQGLQKGVLFDRWETHLQPPLPQGSEPRVSEPTGSEPRVSEPLVSEPL